MSGPLTKPHLSIAMLGCAWCRTQSDYPSAMSSSQKMTASDVTPMMYQVKTRNTGELSSELERKSMLSRCELTS